MMRWLQLRAAGRVDWVLAVALIVAAAWYLSPGNANSQTPAGAEPARCAALPTRAAAAAPGQFFVPIRSAGTSQPWIYAQAAVAIDAATGRVLYSRGMHERRPPASTTKIMTAIVALELLRDESETVITQTDASKMRGSSVMGLWPAARVTYTDLLYGLMLPSGNDAAVELAAHLAPTRQAFVDEMNARVMRMGLEDTHFVNPHGLDNPEHYTSAYDLAMIARYAMGNARFREIVGARQHRLSSQLGYDVYNGNSLLSTYPGAQGVKIGWTNRAGWTFVASAQRNGREVIIALLNTPDRNADATALLDWSFASFTWREAERQTGPALRLFDELGLSAALEPWFAQCLPLPVAATSSN